jgi:hypothetical protein
MTSRIAEISQRRAARIAGIAYLIIFVLGLYANFFIFENLIVPGDSAATANNIIANQILFRSGMVTWIVVLVCDVIIAWALYIFLKPVSRNISLFAAWFRLVYCTIFGVTLLNLLIVTQLLSGAGYLDVFSRDQLHALVSVFLKGYNYGFLIGLVFFSIHLLLLAYLIFRSGFVSKILGFLLFLSFLGYVTDSFANFLLTNYADYKIIFLLLVAIPGIVGELSFTLWLLFKGVKVEPVVQ